MEFETTDPALRGTMTMTTTLVDAAGGTDVLVVHEGIPDAIPERATSTSNSSCRGCATSAETSL
jgi:hypothetical protein